MSARSRRRWFQFSIRQLLVLTTLGAIGLGLWGSNLHRRHQVLKTLTGLQRARIRFADEGRASWLHQQKWLTRLVGEHFFDDSVDINLTAAKGPQASSPTPMFVRSNIC